MRVLKNIGNVCVPCDAGYHYDCIMLAPTKCPDCGSTDYQEGSFFGGKHYKNEKNRRGSYRCRNCGRVFKAASLKDCVCASVSHPYMDRAQLTKPVITPVPIVMDGGSVVSQIGAVDLSATPKAPTA